MQKIILQSFLGIILFLGGIYLLYLFFNSLTTSGNILFLIGSLVLIAGGVFFFIKVGKSDNMFTAHPSVETTEEMKKNEAKEKSILEKNNALLGDWKKTNETKDRLRMLEISASNSSDS